MTRNSLLAGGRSPQQWLDAARELLGSAGEQIASEDKRALLATLKSAGGFALRALLLTSPQKGWGTSPTEHLAGLADSTRMPAEVRAAARRLHDAQPREQDLVQIGPPTCGPRSWHSAADVLVSYVASAIGSSRQSATERPN